MKMKVAKTILEIGNHKRRASVTKWSGGRIRLLFTGESKHDGEYFEVTKAKIATAKRAAKVFVKTGRVPNEL
jgi:hypothetical protein